ncbi:CNP1-like family protein [Variovorax sp. efr-133-TYG-130]|uniref:CNP1-like family protein n=1 Tax=Variovorax sp. efr-133-TYG-130 TaxID=3040327 RepID=UPI0025571DEA|nr:CNP1-like family protein [Variovorax sp. efr-133-TYG-130]
MTLLPTTKRPSFRRNAERALLLACFGVLAGCASGNHDTDNADWAQAGMPPPPKRTETDKEWAETAVPPPPAFSESRLLPISMPPYMSLQFGIDPNTIAITGDGIVRYVVVAHNRSGGAVNAFYEGVRCATSEMKSYARYNEGRWHENEKPEWKRFYDLNSSYTKALAGQALCRGNAPRASVGEMVQNIRNPVREVQ